MQRTTRAAPATNITDRSGTVNAAVSAVRIVSGGTGGTNGVATVTGTTGAGAKFQVNVTIVGGAIATINSISVAGTYTDPPSGFAAGNVPAEPVAGANLVGATLALTMTGISTLVMAANASRRKFDFQPTSVTVGDWALNKNGNGIAASLGAPGSLQLGRMSGTSLGNGQNYEHESTAAIVVYNATAFASFTASEY